jgi:hypothetical protein
MKKICSQTQNTRHAIKGTKHDFRVAPYDTTALDQSLDQS